MSNVLESKLVNSDVVENMGFGKPWKYFYSKNSEQENIVINREIHNYLPDVLSDSAILTTKSRVYLLGGWNKSNWTSTVYTASIDDSGKLGKWSIANSLPKPLGWSQAVVIKNKAYLIGGNNNGWEYIICSSDIGEDGTLGEWRIIGELPEPLSLSQAIVIKNRLYLLGGHNGENYTSNVYFATLNDDGTLGEWNIESSLPNALGSSQAIVTKNRVYLLGGYNFNNGHISTVYTATINSDGTLGTWVVDSELPEELGASQAVVIKNKVYLLGGRNKDKYISTVYSANIKNDGTLDKWTIGGKLPMPLAYAQAAIIKNRLYVFGGVNDINSVVPIVCSALIN